MLSLSFSHVGNCGRCDGWHPAEGVERRKFAYAEECFGKATAAQDPDLSVRVRVLLRLVSVAVVLLIKIDKVPVLPARRSIGIST